MAIVVARIDDRLVHGQVVIGWGRPLEVDRIVLVDGDVAGSEFERELYEMAVPQGIAIEFLSPDDAPARIRTLGADAGRALVLTGSVDTMVTLARRCPEAIVRVNLGGIHDRPGRREYLRYLYLTAEELAQLDAVEATGVEVSAQDLPTRAPVPLAALHR